MTNSFQSDISILGAPLPRAQSASQLRPCSAVARRVFDMEHSWAPPLYVDQLTKKSDLFTKRRCKPTSPRQPTTTPTGRWRTQEPDLRQQAQEADGHPIIGGAHIFGMMSQTAQSLSNENAKLRDKMSLQAHNEKLRVDAMAEQMAQQMAEHKLQMQKCKDELSALREQLGRSTGDHDATLSVLKDLKAEKEALQSQIEQLRNQVADGEVENARLQANLQEYRDCLIPALITEWDRKLQTARAERDAQAAQSQVEQALMSDEVAANEAEAHQQKLADADRRAVEVAAHAVDIAAISREMRAQEAVLAHQEVEQRKAKERAASQRAALLTKQMVGTLSGRQGESAMRTTIAELQDQLQADDAKIQELQRQLVEQRLSRSIRVFALRTSRYELQRREKELHRVNEVLRRTSEELKRKGEELEAVKPQVRKMEVTVQEQTLELKKLNNLKVPRLETRVAELEATLEAQVTEEQLQKQIEEQAREISRLKAKFASIDRL